MNKVHDIVEALEVEMSIQGEHVTFIETLFNTTDTPLTRN